MSWPRPDVRIHAVRSHCLGACHLRACLIDRACLDRRINQHRTARSFEVLNGPPVQLSALRASIVP
eukprot:11861551-Alexandrium_andersonii.AAC.1